MMTERNSLLAELLAPEKGTLLEDLLAKVKELEEDIVATTNDGETLLRVKDEFERVARNISARLQERRKKDSWSLVKNLRS